MQINFANFKRTFVNSFLNEKGECKMKTLKKILALSIIAGLMFGLTASLQAEGTAKDGKTIFADSKCSNCHSIDSQKIEAKKKTDKTVDLSKAGEKNDSAFITKYLKKDEVLNGKKHPVAFKGEDADLETLTKWLAGLK